jgi:hypothetical protein
MKWKAGKFFNSVSSEAAFPVPVPVPQAITQDGLKALLARQPAIQCATPPALAVMIKKRCIS